MARRRFYKPGTESYARQRATLLKKRSTMAAGRASRAKRPEAKKKALRQASAARAELRKIDRREELRRSLTGDMLKTFNRSTLRQQDYELLVHRVERQYPNSVPHNVPDPFVSVGPMRGKAWSLYYSRQGMRRREAAD